MADEWENLVAPIKFLGIKYDDWEENFATFANHQYLLVRDYISDGCNCSDTSSISDSNVYEFLYPFNIAKRYFMEGRIEGEFTLAASGATSFVTDYTVTVWKINDETNTSTQLATTNVRTVDTTLAWDSDLSVGDEIVYHYWIELLDEKEITENDRLFIRIEVTGSNTLVLYHENAGSFEDVWVKLPFRFG